MHTIDCNKAAEILFELFKRHPWLIAPTVMQAKDAVFEHEAIQALLSFNPQTQWNGVSEGAQRVASSLLLDFMAKLMARTPAWRSRSFQIDPTQSDDDQALSLIVGEISQSHPQLANKQ